MAFHETLLDGIELAILLEPFHGSDRMPVGHGRQDRAGLHRFAVQPHHARAAVTGVTAPVRAAQQQLVAQEVDQQHAVLNLFDDLLSIHVD